MDDHTHTRKTLDDLAELYLTGLVFTGPVIGSLPNTATPL